MLTATKFPLGEKLVWLLIRTSLRKHFDRIFLRMQTPVTAAERTRPIIICANHSSWWDGYVAALVERYLHLDGYLMMEEPQLKRYFFFRWIGCFSVNRQNARSAIQTIQYAARLLKEKPGRMVWLFPEGEISRNDHRPLIFFSGAAHIARLAAPALIYPAAIRIEYLAEQHPDLYISLGEPLQIGEEELQMRGFLKNYTKELECKVTRELDQLKADVVAGADQDFIQILRGRTSTNRIFDAALLRKQIKHQ
ncbi:lysophospholipid acyltransferase family protein [Dictyobacter arantiisoli]|uniref:Glycerol acyltransferase n=1 Tax=Dictyobacter arantiisoli TaxID=2014874 RepID=A0A5A5TIT9_9CHLR|nr:lysophospholipid acyltransferase family protein [Dictyobacter arantiisoli]GCF11145.1 glycerol acyltransferase [Dictyobacter arantiisoli]